MRPILSDVGGCCCVLLALWHCWMLVDVDGCCYLSLDVAGQWWILLSVVVCCWMLLWMLVDVAVYCWMWTLLGVGGESCRLVVVYWWKQHMHATGSMEV